MADTTKRTPPCDTCPCPAWGSECSRYRTTEPEPHVQAVEYVVNCLPEDAIDGHLFGMHVQYRGEGRWAVTRHGDCLGADGEWAQGIKPYGRGDDWLNSHRFDLDTALELAKAAAPKVTVNGITVARALAMRGEATA